MTSRNQSSSNAKTLLIWLGGAVVVIGLVAVVLSSGGSSGSGADHADLQGDPVVTGDFLPSFQTGTETATGSPVPEVVGADFDGSPVSIEHNGKPKMIVFLAHWCPHCRAEVPEINAWLESNTIPDEIEFLSVATSIDRSRVNFPPSSWLEDEDWTVPLILDSAGSEAYVAYGAGGFPFWAMVDGQGNLITRVSGQGRVNLTEWTALLEGLATS